jgi:hypothetical protein
MASSLLFSSPLCSPSSLSISKRNSSHSNGGKMMRRVPMVVRSSSEESKGKAGDDDAPSFNPFGFVTDNPSSRSAIQLPQSPAEDGNVGQMLYVSSV